jgi:uncharacterized protein YcbK (DUF882 family)
MFVRRILVAAVGMLMTSPAALSISPEPLPITPSAMMSIKKQSFGSEAPSGKQKTLGTLFQTHTGEIVAVSETEPSNEAFSELLRDRVTNEQKTFAPQLLERLRRLLRDHPHARIELVSGYRSAKLNEMLRKKGHHVASKSQHSLGHAVDFRLRGLSPKELRRELEHQGWHGGLGQYDKPSDYFVHIDVGPDRRWMGK